MTVEELIECLMDIPVEQWDMNVVFGSAYPGMDVVIVEEVYGQIELSFWRKIDFFQKKLLKQGIFTINRWLFCYV